MDGAMVDPLARLRFLVDVVELESEHLQQTDSRLFAQAMNVERATSLRADISLAEQVDAFVVRFGRLQDTLADKLLPLLLDQSAEPLGTVIDNLQRAEKLGWVESVDDWMTARKLRNRMIHEYVRDPEVLSAALQAGHEAVPLLSAAVGAMATAAKCRIGA